MMGVMDIRQIRYLASAVEGGSLSAAAKTQFVTVQAVSKAISELESELGIQLLVRGNHGIAPTAVGAALYRRARHVLDSFDELVDFTRNFPADKADNRLTICLCSPQFNNDDKALGNLAKLTGSHLGIVTNIISATGEQCMEALHSHTVDAVASIGEFSSPDCDVVTIGHLPSGIVLSTHHPLANDASVRIDDLADYPVLWTEKWDSFNRSILETYRTRGLKSPVIPYEDGMDIDDFFQRQLGCIFAVHLSGIKLTNPDTINLPIDASCAARIPLNLITLKSYKTPAYLALEKHVGEIFRGGRIL